MDRLRTQTHVVARIGAIRMSRPARILAVLADHPGGLAAENLLREADRPTGPGERALMLRAIGMLAAAGRVTIRGKLRRTEIAGALIQATSAPPKGTPAPARPQQYRRRIAADAGQP
jgi:hypothetical protein